ncbi:putative glycosyl transferase, group 2 family protein [Erwinia phage vB_EamM_Yoloswag]|uniref:Putative glycosyl transferase, group 2 family protein n=1 Tax=Erwinia phage vB_EamM_Yoloswag TaxID=1958956 RepID=A0A1S6L362_9CAUD|nr:beta-1,4-glycosyltransferase [Erwinia phage vB_EamM_Yoloswag]AQT28624.1 putative glycosyl transferase, group 2 family protein [Erwinia phage vB_EamM_Yoloswag]
MTEFLKHVRGADAVSIVDTGSTDNTSLAFEQYDHPNFYLSYDVAEGVRDLSRSRNLAAAPFSDDDLVVWLDIDERFSDPDWVQTLRDSILHAPDLRCLWITMHNGTSVYGQTKAYRKAFFEWRYHAHEVLISRRPDDQPGLGSYSIEAFHTDHFPDYDKPRDYINELAADAAHYPHDHRAAFYYAREICYRVVEGQYNLIDEAISEVARLERISQWRDYTALIHIELLKALYMAGRNWQQSAYAAVASRPDRIECYGTASDAFLRQGDNVNALGFAIQGIAAYQSGTAKTFLFDSALSNLDLCFEVAKLSCERLGMIDKAIVYLAQLAQLRGEDVNQSISESGLVEQLNKSGTGTLSETSPTLEVQGDSPSEIKDTTHEPSSTQEESASSAKSE